MAALGHKTVAYFALFFIFLSFVDCDMRYGSPSRTIAVARKKRSGPETISASEAKGGASATLPDSGSPEPVRRKRDVSDGGGGDPAKLPIKNMFELNDTHQLVMIDWAGEGSDVIVAVTRDTEQTEDSASVVLISKDYGNTYKNKTGDFKTKSMKKPIINKFYKNDKFIEMFVFTDVVNKYVYTTINSGETINSHKLAFSPSELVHHPTDPLVLLAYDTEDKERTLWVSEDFGENWRRIGIYVKSYYWLETTSPPTLYVEREEPSSKASVVSSTELFREGTTITTVITDVEDFEVKDEFLFASKKYTLLGSKDHQPVLQLWVSYRQGPFMRAEFPTTLPHQHYYIADISEGQVMVCVAHDQVMSNLYVSSVPRSANHQLRFSLSLERILYFNPSTNWVDTWLSIVADKTFADLHPVDGIRGVFIASQLLENYTKSGNTLGPEHLTSYITFDQGALWRPIQPPATDVNGKVINCKDNCSLHLSQEFSRLYPSTQSKSILSKKSAPGLILATGTIGKSLKGHSALYLSTDAGINWYQVLLGNYIYTIGDHGGVIVAVQMYQANGTTNEIQYSIDEGFTWQSFKFSDEKMRVYGLMTEPGENTTIFTLFGSRSEKHQWVFIKIDMRPVFDKACSKSTDYKTWSPTDGRGGHKCLLGRKQVYERRVPHVKCYNGLDYDRPISVENCPCDRDDYECDFGFIVNEDTLACEDDQTDVIDPYATPATCQPWQMYNRTKGYRKVPGDTCEGGREYLYRPTLAACPVREDQEFLLVSTRQEIMYYSFINTEVGLEPLPIPGLRMVIALDFDMKNNTVYWSDVDEKKIKRLHFDGLHEVETLVETNLQSVEGLALDWVANNLYFIDGERKTLEVIRTDISYFGRMRRTLLDSKVLDNPRGIAVHPHLGFLYITDWSESKPMVARSFMDGKNLTVLFGPSVVGWPNGITIDFQTDRIFFADAKLDYIASADLDGKNMRKIIDNSEKVMQPFALGIYKNLLFWDDWTVHQVLQADKEFGWGIAPISNFTKKGLVDLKVFGHWSQQGTNACGDRKSINCTYLCMARPDNKYSCLCPDGMKVTRVGLSETCSCPDGSAIQENGTCKSEESTCSANFFRCSNHRCIPRQWLCDIDNDCGDNSDEDEKECGRKPCDAPAWQCDNGHCIAPSWRCDHDNDCGDNSDEKDCHHTSCPPTTFQCNNGRCIHRNWVCDLEDDCRDGSDEANCTRTPKSGCRGTEYTCSDSRCIPGSWRCDGDRDCGDGADETNCTNVKCDTWQFQCANKQCIYKTWQCDGEVDCADGSDEKNCTNVTPVPEPPVPFGPFIPPANLSCTALMFRCKNTHCIPFWWRCDGLDDCGDASDEEDCDRLSFGNLTTEAPPPTTEAPSHACKKDQFTCSDGKCIWDSWVCDGEKDCAGGEDEDNCHQSVPCADLKGFTCRRSGGCISSKSLCDGHKDCADGSDEEGCVTAVPDVPDCPVGYFSCDGGACLESFKLCDGNHNCKDLSDEQHCSGGNERGYFVTEFRVMDVKNTSVSVKWEVNDNVTVPQNIQYLPSIIEKAMTGNPNAWHNQSWSSNSSWTFGDLTPYTSYLIKVYIKHEDKVFPPLKPLEFMTEIGIPSVPIGLEVHQIEDQVKVSWQAPVHPNGPVENYKVFFTPPVPPRQASVSGKTTEMTVPAIFLDSPCDIWVKVSNLAYVSNASEHVRYVRKSVDALVNWTVVNVTASVAHLKWDPAEGVEGYVVSHSRPENKYQLGEVTKNTTETEIYISNLAPNTKYIFKVRAFKSDMLGPALPKPVTTKGESLTKVKNLEAVVVKETGTTVKVTWNEPAYVEQKVLWEYIIIWGKSTSDLKHSVNVGKTKNTTFVIDGLEACEEYIIAVMVGGPIGIGPVSEKEVTTAADYLAPPKNLHVTSIPENTTTKITWEPSCPYKRNDSFPYILKITDMVKGRDSNFLLTSKTDLIQSHVVNVHYGGKYNVSVRTNLTGARFAEPYLFDGPTIPPPYELTFHQDDESFFWRPSQDMPKKLLNESNTYVLYISKNNNMSEARAYPTVSPPLILDDLSPGVIYYAAVTLKDPDGYFSPKSDIISLEKPIGNEIVLSQNSVVGVAVSVFLVVVALIAIVAILAVRHRRLARSFITFANTHYDRSQGTTLITTDHNLDEDDDSPMIRGFSDDEPMVIA